MAGKRMAQIVRTGVCHTTAAYRPAPTLFCYPGLTSKPWHDPNDFEWVDMLRKNTPLIREEYLALKEAGVPSDYTVGEGEHTLHRGSWEWHSYVLKGARQQAFADKCPTTVAMLESIPNFMSQGVPFAFSFFSTMPGGTQIAPHTAPCNIRLRCHLPLIVPDDCHFTIAGETRQWVEGEPLLFDDSYEHEVAHNGDGDRVVLLFDMWHPDLLPGEVAEIVAMFDHAREQGWMK